MIVTLGRSTLHTKQEEEEEEEEGEEEFQVWNPLIWVFDMNSKVSMDD